MISLPNKIALLSTNKNRLQKHALWSIFLTGLVMLTCLASLLSSQSLSAISLLSPNTTNANSVLTRDDTQSTSSITDIAQLYFDVFSDSSQQIKKLPTEEPCSLSEKMLTYSAPKLHWLACFLLLTIIIFSVIPDTLRRFREEQRDFQRSKHHLHLTYCIFRE